MRRAILLLMLSGALPGHCADRYAELRAVIDRNTGFAHATRGVNMYTLYALRACVSDADLPVLRRLLTDKDRIIRMAAADVMADLGPAGKDAVRARMNAVKEAGERLMLDEALSDASKPDYRPILQYPLTDRERAGIRGCK